MGTRMNILDSVIMGAYPTGGVQALGVADSQSNLFFARELESIIPDIFKIDYARINARNLFPIDRSHPPSTKIVTYRQFDQVGAAKVIVDYANDIPIAKVSGAEFSGKVRTFGMAAQWSVDEIDDAAAVGRPLDRMQIDAAREANLRKENDVAFDGDADHGLIGLFSDPNIPEVAAGTGTWSGATGVQMVDDMNACADAIPTNTGDVEMPTRLAISSAQYRIAKRTQHSTATDTTALNYFLQNHDTIKEVVPVREFAGKGPGGEDVMMAYTPDPSKVRMIVTLELEQRPPQENGLAIHVIIRHKFGGLLVIKPMSMNIVYGI